MKTMKEEVAQNPEEKPETDIVENYGDIEETDNLLLPSRSSSQSDFKST